MSSSLQAAIVTSSKQKGFDSRTLLKVTTEHLKASDVDCIPGVDVISEEGDSVAIIFSNAEGLHEFEHRLGMIAGGSKPTREGVLFALRGFDAWSAEDRASPAVTKLVENADEAEVCLDVELWPIGDDRPAIAQQMLKSFDADGKESEFDVLDSVSAPVILARVRCSLSGLAALLEHRDVRAVDLPPRFQLNSELLRLPLNEVPEPSPPEPSAPRVGILDSGILSNHPLLRGTVGDADSYINELGPEDEHGHGTAVAGVAAFGDIAARANTGLTSAAWIMSGRVLDAENEYSEELIENQVRRAVSDLTEDDRCRVFNLSLGNERYPYVEGRLRSFAMTLDSLAHEYGVLFVVSSGNYDPGSQTPEFWRNSYPGYLSDLDARVLDPGTALNALTVGSIAEHTQTKQSTTYPKDPAYQPIAGRNEPSPFTRSGPSYGGAIKPELVEYGGNLGFDARGKGRPIRDPNLGVMLLNQDFIADNLFRSDFGTSFAAPRVTNTAALLLRRYPNASANLLRALIVASARVPEASAILGGEASRLVGYGRPDPVTAAESGEKRVTLMAEDTLGIDKTHFYELPLPEDFFAYKCRRKREITIAVSHMPAIRPGRLDYRMSQLSFRLVRADSAEEVEAAFRHKSEAASMSEENLVPGPNARKPGTVQAATWTIGQVDKRWGRKRVFVAVTRTVPTWAEPVADTAEPYALVGALADYGKQAVRYYTQIKAKLPIRQRGRVRG